MQNLYVRGRGACGHYSLWRDKNGALWCRCVSWDGTIGVPQKLDPQKGVGYLAYNTNQPRHEAERAIQAALSAPPERDERIGDDPALQYAAESGWLQSLG